MPDMHTGHSRLWGSIAALSISLMLATSLSVAARYSNGGTVGHLTPPSIDGLTVSGTSIVNEQGQKIFIHSVDRSGSEYQCVNNLMPKPDTGDPRFFEGPVNQKSVAAMKRWHINAVTILINEECWLGKEGLGSKVVPGLNPHYSGKAYRETVTGYAHLLIKNNLIPIVDLSWSAPGARKPLNQQPMPDLDHSLQLWRSVANTFKSDSSVMFELFGEPYPEDAANAGGDPWQCWLNAHNCPSFRYWDYTHRTEHPYLAVGMQQLINAIRAQGATNIIMLSGINYADDLTKWLAKEPRDPRSNLVADWHAYNPVGSASLAARENVLLPVIQKVPLIAGELGEYDCKSTFIDHVMQFLDQNGDGYVAWTWGPTYAKCIADATGNTDTISLIQRGKQDIEYYQAIPWESGKGYHGHMQCLWSGACRIGS